LGGNGIAAQWSRLSARPATTASAAFGTAKRAGSQRGERHLLAARIVSQHSQRNSQGGKPHERENPPKEQAPDEDQRERASASNGYVDEHGHEGTLWLLFR
jgi:hypothetical protein